LDYFWTQGILKIRLLGAFGDLLREKPWEEGPILEKFNPYIFYLKRGKIEEIYSLTFPKVPKGETPSQSKLSQKQKEYRRS